MEYETVMTRLVAMESVGGVEGMRRFGIDTSTALGITLPALRKLAKEIGTDQKMSLKLWDSGVHEGMVLATILGDPKKVSDRQLERWVHGINSWDICDSACGNLFWKTDFALDKAAKWSTRKPEFEKRAAFSLMAYMAVHRKEFGDDVFSGFLPLIVRESADDRNFVRKAVNWALREIGKRNANLNRIAIKTAEDLKESELKSARWIGSDAYRELTGDVVQQRLSR